MVSPSCKQQQPLSPRPPQWTEEMRLHAYQSHEAAYQRILEHQEQQHAELLQFVTAQQQRVLPPHHGTNVDHRAKKPVRIVYEPTLSSYVYKQPAADRLPY